MATAAAPRGRGRPPKNPVSTEAPRRRGRPPKNPAPAEEEVIGDYERLRAAKISENMKKMQELGVLHLAQTLRQPAAASLSRRTKVKPGPPRLPSRSSLRLKGVEPDSFCEIRAKHSKEEIYTEEHEKLLGTCNTPWTFFVDGSATLQRCHQCYKKALRHHTSCCKCQNHHWPFCGDCLYKRYGENVLEVKKNPKWLCPICRGICNSSVCRAKKGWLPTGKMYSKVVALGYKSVAHFLIATHRAPSVNSKDSSSVALTDKECSNVEKVAHISGQSMDEHTATTPEKLIPLAKSGGKKRPRAVRGAAH